MKVTALRTLQKGFTLVELLVVIGILGILAAALIATIDPIEQINRANDTNKRNTAVEMLNAVTRYYAIRSAYPWDPIPPTNNGINCMANNGAAFGPVVTNTGPFYTACIGDTTPVGSLIETGELKASFRNATSILSDLYATYTVGANGYVSVCFIPDSKAIKSDPNTRYNQNGSTTPACVAPNCHWCAR